MTHRAAGAKKTRKATPPAFTLEPYDIHEWFDLCAEAAAGRLKKVPNLQWLETKNGTLWPHKVVRDA